MDLVKGVKPLYKMELETKMPTGLSRNLANILFKK